MQWRKPYIAYIVKQKGKFQVDKLKQDPRFKIKENLR